MGYSLGGGVTNAPYFNIVDYSSGYKHELALYIGYSLVWVRG